MEVSERNRRTRPDVGGHVVPANQPFESWLWCSRVSACAQPDVPVSYPRTVVCSQKHTTETVDATDHHHEPFQRHLDEGRCPFGGASSLEGLLSPIDFARIV